MVLGDFGATAFFVSTGLFQALFIVGVSYQMGAIAKLDIQGRYLVTMTAAQGLGGALGPALAALVPRICLGPLRQRWPYLSLNSHSPTSPSENRRQAMASPRGDQESIETPSALSRSLGLPPAVGATMTVSP